MKVRYLLTGIAVLALPNCSMNRIAVRAIPDGYGAAPSASSALDAGRNFFRRGEYALATVSFRRSLREDGENVDAYNGLAASYDQLNRFDLSRRYYELALAIAPEDGRVLRNLARSFARQGETFAARKLFEEVTALEARQARTASLQAEQSIFDAGSSVTVAIDASATIAVPDTPAPSTETANVVKDQPRVRVINAVGRAKQAARMRAYLAADGWQKVATGNTRWRLMRPRVLFDAGSRQSAHQLAKALPFTPTLQPSKGVRGIMLMLGRDAVAFDNRLKDQRG